MRSNRHNLRKVAAKTGHRQLAALKRCCQRETAKRKLAEKTLRTHEQGLLTFLDAMPVAIAIYANDRFLFSNKAHSRLVGADDPGELIGRPVLDIIDPEYHELFLRRTRKVREEGAEVPLIPYVCRRLDNKPVFVETIAVPFFYEGGLAVMGVAIDVTRRKRDEEQLKDQREQLLRAEKMALLGKLASGVGHEINNPNNFIQLNASLLAKIWQDIQPLISEAISEQPGTCLGGLSAQDVQEQLPKLAKDILDGSRRITHIVKELKDFARPDLPEIIEEVNLNQVITAALKLLQNVTKSANGRLNLELMPDIPLIRGNFHRLERVMINLIMNSYQALNNPAQGISISTGHQPDTGHVLVEVLDEGIGIEPKDLEHVTDPFFTTRRDIGGTGLGLSVSSRIVADHMGSMEFESAPNQGTKVTLCFPVLKYQPATEPGHD
ncbi:MAG: ATP-binding protein [Desulfarculaceae bacterium]